MTTPRTVPTKTAIAKLIAALPKVERTATPRSPPRVPKACSVLSGAGTAKIRPEASCHSRKTAMATSTMPPKTIQELRPCEAERSAIVDLPADACLASCQDDRDDGGQRNDDRH